MGSRGITYKPATGFWGQSGDHKLAYAAHGVKALMDRRAANPLVRKAQYALMRAMRDPVEKFDWGTWFTKNHYKSKLTGAPTKAESVNKGDLPGHEFRGNQYSMGGHAQLSEHLRTAHRFNSNPGRNAKLDRWLKVNTHIHEMRHEMPDLGANHTHEWTKLKKGDLPGHEFHGNQYTEGAFYSYQDKTMERHPKEMKQRDIGKTLEDAMDIGRGLDTQAVGYYTEEKIGRVDDWINGGPSREARLMVPLGSEDRAHAAAIADGYRAYTGHLPPAAEAVRQLTIALTRQDLPAARRALADVKTHAGYEEPVKKSAALASTGAFMALLPAVQDAHLLASQEERPEDLHCTLAYFGAAVDLPQQIKRRIMRVANSWASRSPFGSTLSGADRFGDAYVVTVLDPRLIVEREELVAALGDAGIEVDTTFSEYKPHVTLSYHDDLTGAITTEGSTWTGGSITFDRVLVAFGDVQYVIPLMIRKALPDDVLGSIDPVIDLYKKKSKAKIDQAVKDLNQAAAAHISTQLSVPFDAADVQAGIDASFDQYGSNIADTSADDLRGLIEDVLDSGPGNPADFSKALRYGWNAFTKDKADQIAWTEYNNVASQATLSSYKSNGIEYKAWLTVGDNNVCEDCQANEDEGPIPIDDSFPSGDDAPPQHPDCRCNVTSVVSPDTAIEGDFTVKYDDSEARDDHGRWTADGGVEANFAATGKPRDPALLGLSASQYGAAFWVTPGGLIYGGKTLSASHTDILDDAGFKVEGHPHSSLANEMFDTEQQSRYDNLVGVAEKNGLVRLTIGLEGGKAVTNVETFGKVSSDQHATLAAIDDAMQEIGGRMEMPTGLRLQKGDLPGHEFHGNQYTDGGGFVDQNTVPRQTKLGPVTFQESGDAVGQEYHSTYNAFLEDAPDGASSLGYVSVAYDRGGKNAYIKMIEVPEQHRRMGVATALLDRVKAEGAKVHMLGNFATDAGQGLMAAAGIKPPAPPSRLSRAIRQLRKDLGGGGVTMAGSQMFTTGDLNVGGMLAPQQGLQPKRKKGKPGYAAPESEHRIEDRYWELAVDPITGKYRASKTHDLPD